MNKLTEFDCNSATDYYEWLMHSIIWSEDYIMCDFFEKNQQNIFLLNAYFEKRQNFEKCFWILEMNNAFFSKIQKSPYYNSNHPQTMVELNNDYYKKILLNVIYNSKQDFHLRFNGMSKAEFDRLILFFENQKDFEKCYWLHEISKHFEFECMMNICRLMPDW